MRAAGHRHRGRPGITAALGCAARGRPAADVPQGSLRLCFVTAHRADEALEHPDWSTLADPQTTVVVYMGLLVPPPRSRWPDRRRTRPATRRPACSRAARGPMRKSWSGGSKIWRRWRRSRRGAGLLVIGEVVARSDAWRRSRRPGRQGDWRHDLAAATEAQDHRAGGGHRQPARRWRRRLSHRSTGAGRPARSGRGGEHGAGRSGCSRRPRPTTSARSAPMWRRSASTWTGPCARQPARDHPPCRPDRRAAGRLRGEAMYRYDEFDRTLGRPSGSPSFATRWRGGSPAS